MRSIEVKLDLTKPIRLPEEEDEETLVAIDQGALDAEQGRVTPVEEVERMLSKWISSYSSPTSR